MQNQVGPTVVTISDHPGTLVHTQLREKVFKGLGITQIVAGSLILCLAFRFIDGQRLAVGVQLAEQAIMFIVTGSFTCVASKRKTQCMIFASLTLSVVSVIYVGYIIDPVIKAIWMSGPEMRLAHSVISGLTVGLLAIMVVVSIVVAAFGCGTVCCRCCCCGGKQMRPPSPPPAYDAPPTSAVYDEKPAQP